jgi:3-carboxy-cis,cis-muconate cycloisomerase
LSTAEPADAAFDTGLLTPGAVATQALVADAAVVATLVEVEVALVGALEEAGIAPAGTEPAVAAAAGAPVDAAELARAGVTGGNPVIPLVALLHERVAARDAGAAGWVHRGATSQDVLDTGLMLLAARALDALLADLRTAVDAAAALAATHRDTLQVGRTLTQHSTPITFGLTAAQWARGLHDAAIRLAEVRRGLPVQLGGASGTLASFVQLGAAEAAARVGPLLAERLGLRAAPPWHTRRGPVTRLGDALAATTDAAGVVAADVALLGRPEIGELAEGSGGGSSTMPHKRNPVASVLLASLALRAPGLAADLHRSAALAVDQRPDGAWHAEWPALRELLRLALGAGSLVAGLLGGLRVDAGAMARNLAAAGPAVLSERVALAEGPDAAARLLADPAARAGDPLLDPAGYTGLAGALVDELLAGLEPR